MKDNRELLLRAKNGDKNSSDMLVENNMGLVYSVVNKLSVCGYEYEDLIQIGSMGLLKAVQKFDMSYDVKFSTYAVPMILGEIKRFLRDDGMVKVSRGVKENAIKGRRAAEKLEKRLGRTPTMSEISAECGVESDMLLEAFDAVAPVKSLQAATDDDEKLTLMSLISGENTEDKIVDKLSVKQSLMRITKCERDVIVMRYFKCKTQTEIAEKLGVSQVQVSRIEKKALIKMREEHFS